jgi:hypothetical protein
VKPLARHCLLATALASVAVLVLALAAGAVRLLPWLMAAEVPLVVALPFAKALAVVAVETALVVGFPVGFSLGAAIFVERGEARALQALGVSPLELVMRSASRAAAAAAVAAAVVTVCDVDARAPGRIAAQLIEQGRSSCAGATEPRSALVPMVGVTWLCFPGQPPRVTGPLPRSGGRAWFTAAELHASDDLRTFVLEDLRLVTRPGSGLQRAELRVRHATVTGLRAWGRPSTLTVTHRAALIASTSLVLGLLVAWLVVAGNLQSRVGAAFVGAVPALVAIHALHRVDAIATGPGEYAWVPGTAMLAACGAWALVWAVQWVWKRWRLRPA